MNKKEAIKYLKQLYPNGGHCWLDEQRMEAIGMAVKALQEEPVSEDKMTISKEWFDHCKKSWYNEGYIDGEYNRDRQFEKPVSEDFEKALEKEWKGYNDRCAATVDALEDNTQELAFAKGFYRGAKWQEEKDNICYEEIFEEGAEWKADEFEKERLKQCDTLTKEQAKIESDFVTNFIKKNNCTPTFIDAIEYGMKMQKDQMMAKAADMVVGYWMPNGLMLTVDETENCYNIDEGDRVKVIVIKED